MGSPVELVWTTSPEHSILWSSPSLDAAIGTGIGSIAEMLLTALNEVVSKSRLMKRELLLLSNAINNCLKLADLLMLARRS